MFKKDLYIITLIILSKSKYSFYKNYSNINKKSKYKRFSIVIAILYISNFNKKLI